MVFNLIKATEAHISKGKIRGKNSIHYYPSEASVKIKNPDGTVKILGNCLRKSYLRCIGAEAGEKNRDNNFSAELGNACESYLIEKWKEMGIWEGDHVKWYDSTYNISGELDAILKQPAGAYFGVEIKTIHHYKQETEIFGNSRVIGKPNDRHLLQTVIYKYEWPELEYFEMFYLHRGSGRHTTYRITLIQDELADGKVVHRPMVEGHVIMDYTVEDIFDRYQLLDDCIKNKVVPPADFKYKYEKEEIEKRWKNKDISKSKYDLWKKTRSKSSSNWPGDWECRYCPYTNLCFDGFGNLKEITANGDSVPLEDLDIIISGENNNEGETTKS